MEHFPHSFSDTLLGLSQHSKTMDLPNHLPLPEVGLGESFGVSLGDASSVLAVLDGLSVSGGGDFGPQGNPEFRNSLTPLAPVHTLLQGFSSFGDENTAPAAPHGCYVKQEPQPPPRTPLAARDSNVTRDVSLTSPLKPAKKHRAEGEDKEIHRVKRKWSGPGRNPQSMAKRNARERRRVQNINHSLENLEQILPETYAAQTKDKKLSKLQVLKCTIEYIRTLEDVLDQDNQYQQLQGYLGPAPEWWQLPQQTQPPPLQPPPQQLGFW